MTLCASYLTVTVSVTLLRVIMLKIILLQIIMLIFIMLISVTLSVIKPNDFIVSGSLLNAIMMCKVVLNGLLLSVIINGTIMRCVI